jgi:hypothetical protein
MSGSRKRNICVSISQKSTRIEEGAGSKVPAWELVPIARIPQKMRLSAFLMRPIFRFTLKPENIKH